MNEFDLAIEGRKFVELNDAIRNKQKYGADSNLINLNRFYNVLDKLKQFSEQKFGEEYFEIEFQKLEYPILELRNFFRSNSDSRLDERLALLIAEYLWLSMQSIYREINEEK